MGEAEEEPSSAVWCVNGILPALPTWSGDMCCMVVLWGRVWNSWRLWPGSFEGELCWLQQGVHETEEQAARLFLEQLQDCALLFLLLHMVSYQGPLWGTLQISAWVCVCIYLNSWFHNSISPFIRNADINFSAFLLRNESRCILLEDCILIVSGQLTPIVVFSGSN